MQYRDKKKFIDLSLLEIYAGKHYRGSTLEMQIKRMGCVGKTVHWAGISRIGRAGISIFEGIMKKELYIEIDSCKKTTLSIHNDPKHTSLYARTWMEENSLMWWKTPPESPDLNTIENIWHELKEYIRREVKLKVKQELIDGILSFWLTVDVPKCNKYIDHLHKVIPKVIERNGCTTGY